MSAIIEMFDSGASVPVDMDAWFAEKFDQHMAEREAAHVPSISILVSKGTLDWAYPAFIIGATAGAMGWKTNLFFTFYGLSLLQKKLDPKISPLGNPAMPMKMPFGPEWFKAVNWNIPNAVMATVPGFESLATSLMKMTVSGKGVAPISELREACIDAGVKLTACQMTADLFGMPQSDFIDEIDEWAGAATYLTAAQKADVTLFM